jgi:hypothetical protein
MTLIAGRTVVLISRDVAMLCIHFGLTMFMAADACKNRIVANRRMALRTTRPFVTVCAGIDPEELRVVIVRRRSPSRCRVAWRAIMAQLQCHMIRVGRDCILRCMTLVAIVVGEIIVVVHMTRNTCCCNVSPREREIGVVVIERRRTPGSSRMTFCAILAEVSCNVIRVSRRVEIGLVAANACRRQSLVLVIDMALIAGRGLMRTSQREYRVRMIEC